jgi:putative tryptophan/tyrosine transport system substrate-binding protein
MIDRRRFLQLAAVGGCVVSGIARSQALPGAKRLGALAEGDITPPQAFLDALRERGWIVGQNLLFERRVARRADQLPEAARELVQSKVDLIFTWSTAGARAAKAATTTIPILFDVGVDPVPTGLVDSLARPGSNLTGFAFGLYDEKLLEILKEALPKASRVMYPIATLSAAATRVAHALKVEAIPFAVHGPEDFDAFFQALRKNRPDGVVMPNVGWMQLHATRIAHELKLARMPAIAIWDGFVPAGGLLSYGPQFLMARRVAQIDAILRGANPGDLPVEMPTQFRLAVNLSTAATLGVTIPNSLLVRAHEVIR